MWCKYITHFMIFDSKPGRVRHKFAQLQGTDPGLFLGGVHHVFKPLLRGGEGWGRYAFPARALKIRPCLQCPEPNPSQWAVPYCKPNSVCFCLPRLHLITGVLLMKHWIRRTAQVFPLLFVHTRLRNSKNWTYFPGGNGRRGNVDF